MLFKRRIKLRLFDRARDLLWPRIGMRRTARYLGLRMARLRGGPHSVAAGFACGVMISFTPFIGFHFLIGGVIALAVGGNLIAMAIGTAVGNPWTFPLIWWWCHKLGLWMMEKSNGELLAEQLTLSYIINHPENVLIPMLAGGLITGLIAGFVCYVVTIKIVKTFQDARRARRLKAARRRASRMAELMEAEMSSAAHEAPASRTGTHD